MNKIGFFSAFLLIHIGEEGLVQRLAEKLHITTEQTAVPWLRHVWLNSAVVN